MVLCHIIAPSKIDWINCGGRKLVQIINENANFFLIRKKEGALEFQVVILNFNRDSEFYLMLADLISQICSLITYLDASFTHIS